MQTKSLLAYFVILAVLCAGFVTGARMLGERGMYLAGAYMLTPALAAILTRLFFHKPRFKDAALRLGRLKDYLRFWLYSVGIMALSFCLFTLSGSIRWDFSGQVFLDLLKQQFAATGEDMLASLPPGFTPQMMLWLFVIGGLTVFNIMPGLISGLGEEFGHRGFMFALLFRNRPWLGLVLGGLLWWLWHQSLRLVVPAAAPLPVWQQITEAAAGIAGAICTHIYLSYVLVKSQSIFVTAIAHIAMNNAARSFAYFVVIQDQFTANLAQSLAMLLVMGMLYYSKQLRILVETAAPSGSAAIDLS